MKSLSVRTRRWAALGAALTLSVGVVAWYLHHQMVQVELAERALDDIPKAEYEQWMQDLGYTN